MSYLIKSGMGPIGAVFCKLKADNKKYEVKAPLSLLLNNQLI